MSKYRIKTNFLSYHSVVTALRRYKETFSPHINKTGKREEPKPSFPLTHCRVIYKMLIQKKASPSTQSQTKWSAEDALLDSFPVNWKKTYSLPFLCTKETKLRIFQFKLLQRRIATNDFLYRIGILPTNLCTFCGEAPETLMHLFWNCEYSQIFWKEVLAWIKDKLSQCEGFALSCSMCISFVNEPPDILVQHLFLIARYYIYTCKLKNTTPVLRIFTELVMNSARIEKRFAFETNALRKFETKWSWLDSFLFSR